MTRRVYIAGPMSRESFCRCDRPSARSTLPAIDPGDGRRVMSIPARYSGVPTEETR